MKIKFKFLILATFSVTLSAIAQTREKGPWWPNALWGANDQAGASNWVTPEKILRSVSLVKTGKVYELGHVYERNMPFAASRSYNIFIPSFPTHGPVGEDKIYFNDEYIASEIGQVGTQFDGPGHVCKEMKLENGVTTQVFYNGFTSEEIRNPYGLQKLGVENVKPYVTRGILIDLAAYKGVASLPERYEITLADIQGALKKQGMTENSIEPGDALLFNTGWWRYWPKPIITNGEAVPFASKDVTRWIIERKPSMIGSDVTLDGTYYGIHMDVTMKNGIFNLELMNLGGLSADNAYEFLFVFTPLRLKGATGSPGRPIAIK